jgi:hypothetical protein
MTMRRDAMAGAAEMVLATEELAHTCGIVGTVGALSLEPSAINVILGEVNFTLDARACRMKPALPFLRHCAGNLLERPNATV